MASSFCFRMSFYPPRVNENFLAPQSDGEIEGSDATGETGSFTCGAGLKLTLRIDHETNAITDARFKVTGRGYLIASASVLTEIIRGITTAEAAQTSIASVTPISEFLGGVPDDRAQCLRLCTDVLLTAITQYSESVRSEWNGDEALICTCFCVSVSTIRNEIRTKALRTIEEVVRACNAGAGCRSCWPLIEDVIDAQVYSKN